VAADSDEPVIANSTLKTPNDQAQELERMVDQSD
jgi:hypothetical protein